LETLLLYIYDISEGKYEFFLMTPVNDFLLLQWIYFNQKYIILWYNVEFCNILIIK